MVNSPCNTQTMNNGKINICFVHLLSFIVPFRHKNNVLDFLDLNLFKINMQYLALIIESVYGSLFLQKLVETTSTQVVITCRTTKISDVTLVQNLKKILCSRTRQTRHVQGLYRPPDAFNTSHIETKLNQTLKGTSNAAAKMTSKLSSTTTERKHSQAQLFFLLS